MGPRDTGAEVEDLIGGNEEMYLDTKTGRSWRKSRKRGVSPIIATILLVAITVVLAAVLYVLISNLTSSGSNSTPLGGAFAWGQAHDITNTSSNGCAGLNVCYSIDVASTSSSLQTGGVTFSLKSASGATASLGGDITLVSASGTVLAIYNHTSGQWASGATNVAITGGDALVFNTGGTLSLTGYIVNAVGQNGFTGTVSSPTLPA